MSGQRIDGSKVRLWGASLTAVLALVAALLAVIVVAAPPANAETCPANEATNNLQVVGGFEIDGNLCQNNPANNDWSTVGNQPIATDAVTTQGGGGTTDTTAFTSGADETNGPNWSLGQTRGTLSFGDRDIDVGNIYADTRVVGDSVYAFLGFERQDSGGAVSVKVELNQLRNDDPSCGQNRPIPNPCRTPGDVLLVLDKQGGATPVTLSQAYTWDGSTWQPLGNTGAIGRSNNGTITTLDNRTLRTQGVFGEIAVNLSALFGPTDCSGRFGTINVRTSNSPSLTSALADWVAPVNLGVPSTCPTVTLQKRWVNGANGDRTNLSINGANQGSGFATSTVNGRNGDGTFTDTEHQASVDVEPGSSVHVAEALANGNTGTYATSLSCDHDVVPNANGTFTMPPDLGAGANVTCTFTNTRRQATLTFTKVWDPQSVSGDQVHLRIETIGGTTGPETSTAPASTTITRTVFSGDPVTVIEALGDNNASSYRATTDCGTNVDNLVLRDFGASFTVPNAPTDITCTITNTPIPRQLVLFKTWVNGVNGVNGDTAQLTVTNQGSGATDSATAIVPSGGNGQSGNAASVPIVANQTVTLSETLPPQGTAPGDNRGLYQPTALRCNGTQIPIPDADSSGATGTFQVPANGDAPVTCEFTNEARYTVHLTKEWGPGSTAPDTATLNISNERTNDADQAIATAPNPPVNPASVTAAAGDTIDLAETLDKPGAYAASLSCDNDVTPSPANGTTGSFTVPSDLPADTTITCTFLNESRYTVRLTKEWGPNAVDGDTAQLTIRNGQVNGTTKDTSTVTATAPNPPANPASVSAASGDTISLDETFGDGNVPYDASLSCDAGRFTEPVPGTTGVFQVQPGDVPAGGTITCTFTNTRQQATVVLQKRWNNGATGDQADLAIAGGTGDPSLTATSTVTAADGPTFTDTEHQARATVQTGDPVTLTEDLPAGNTGSYDTTLTCDHDVVPDASGTFTLPADVAGGTVTCTFTNTRQGATVVLQKHWNNGAIGDSTDLSITGGQPNPSPTVTSTVTDATGTTFTDEVDQAAVAVQTGDQVTLNESLAGTNAGGYDTTLSCDNNVVPNANGTFTVTPALANTTVTCTFTNTRQTATVVLQKHWNNGATGDSTTLNIAGGEPNPSSSATSTVTTDTGHTFTDEVNQAAVAVQTGDQVTLTEHMTNGNTGSYDTTLSCDNGVVPNGNGTFNVTAASASTTITCTFNNTRQRATIVLQKHWNNGATGDSADLTITGGEPNPSPTATSTVTTDTGPTFTDEENQAAAAVSTGDLVTLTEDLAGGNTGSYNTMLSCDNGVVPDANGSFTVTAAMVASGVTCTFTNTRQTATVVLEKHWNNGATGDSTDLSIAGGAPDPATATSTVTTDTGPTFTDGANQAAAAVQTGDQVTLTENLAGGNTGSYDTALSCDNGVVPDANGSFTVTAALASTTVTCTFTNTRQSATVVLQKHWNNGATGDRSILSIAGGTPDPATATSTVTAATGPTFTDTSNQASAAVHTGDQVTVSELLPVDNAGSYDTVLSCDNGAQPNAQGTFTVTAAMVASGVTCTFDNTRQSATVVLQKHWNNGATGDSADLTIAGGAPDPATATSTVTDATGSSFTDDVNQAAAAIQTGDQVTVSESLPAGNTGSYNTTLSCDNGAVPDSNGTFTVTGAMVASGVTCTFTNTRQSATVVLQKHWNNGATGDRAILTIDGGEPDPSNPATSVVTAGNGPTFTDTVNQAAVGIRTGDTVTLTEDLPAGNNGSYDTVLSCNNGVTPDNSGSFTVTAAMASTTITCTFTNTRQSATVVLQKHWNNGATGDSADLSIAGGTPDPDTATSTVTAASGSTFTDEENQAAAAVQTGDQVTVTENLPGTNTGSYDTVLSCDNGAQPNAQGTFTVTAAMVASGVTCTFDNTRQTATVVLQKHWNNGATGDSAHLTIHGGTPNPDTATSTVTADSGPSFTDEVNQAAAAIQTGDQVTLTENMPGTNTGSYDTTLSCDNGVTPNNSGSFTVTAAMASTTITCTFTNTRQRATVVLQKHWNNGATGDSADLTITGGEPTPSLTATSTVTTATGATFTDEVNQAAAAIQTGDQVTVAENLPAGNTGSYDTVLSCDNGAEPNAQGTFTVTADMVASGVTCTFTNTRQSATVVLQKAWDTGAINDRAVLTITGGEPDPSNPATSVVTGENGTTFTDTVNQAAVGIQTGDQVTLTEDLPAGNTGSYETELTCDNGVTPDANGTFTVTAAMASTTITCTFTNTRQPATLSITKTSSATQIRPGRQVPYTLTVRNTGPGPATDVVVTDTLPRGLSFVSSTPACAAVGRAVTCTIGAIPVNGVMTIQMVTRAANPFPADAIDSLGNVVNQARVTSPESNCPPSSTDPACTGNVALPVPLSKPTVRTTTSRARVAPGTAFRDRIRVTGLEGRTTAVAQLFGPFSSRAAAACTPAFRVASRSLRVGNGVTRMPTVRRHAVGVYTWRVTLQANPRNQSATHPCGQAAETTVVAKPAYRGPAIKGGFTGTVGSSTRAAAAARRTAIRIRMPSIGMNAPVVPEGIVGRHMVLPSFTKVGWLRKSDSFGDKIGSVVVGGHVSSRRDRPGALFLLKNARAGDLVTVTKAGKTYTYKVSGRSIFSRHRQIPKKYFKTTGKPRLVIVSCVHKKLLPHGRFTYTKYIIVVAKQIS